MRTDDRAKVAGRAPGIEDGAHPGQHRFEVGGFPLEQRPNVDARRVPRAPERHDVPDLGEAETHAAGVAYEREQPQHVLGIVTIAGRGAPRRRENPPRFVQPQRLAAEPGSRRDFPDEEVVAPWVKVKRE